MEGTKLWWQYGNIQAYKKYTTHWQWLFKYKWKYAHICMFSTCMFNTVICCDVKTITANNPPSWWLLISHFIFEEFPSHLLSKRININLSEVWITLGPIEDQIDYLSRFFQTVGTQFLTTEKKMWAGSNWWSKKLITNTASNYITDKFSIISLLRCCSINQIKICFPYPWWIYFPCQPANIGRQFLQSIWHWLSITPVQQYVKAYA